jgi:hypothetical protein
MSLLKIYYRMLRVRVQSITVCWVCSVEGLYCKRPIQCLASSEERPPLTARRVCTSPTFGVGGGHTRLRERGWGVNSSEDARHCSVLDI